MNPMSSEDILTVWEHGRDRVPFEKALLLARLARPEAPPEELAGLPIAERDLMLLDLRERSLGGRLSAFAVCPGCRQHLEFTLKIGDLRKRVSKAVGILEMAIGRFRFRVRPPSTADLASLSDAGDVRASRLELAARCVVDATLEGQPVVLRDLPKRVLSRLADYLDRLEDKAEILIDMTCPACAHSWESSFDIASYFYAELSVVAQRLLEDVHLLASAYGWSEREILAMSPTRRQFYLERSQ